MAEAKAWWRPLLALCPVSIAVLWVAGTSRFRGYELSPLEWAVIVAFAFALHAMSRLASARRPVPPMPAGHNPVTISLLAAAILAVLAAIAAGVLEAVVDHYRPSDVAMGWRATWHAACTFAATYCALLHRLTAAQGRRPKGS